MVNDNFPRKRLRDRRNQTAGKRLINDVVQTQKDINQDESSSVKGVFVALTCGIILTILFLVANHHPTNDGHKKDESVMKIKMPAVLGTNTEDEMKSEEKDEINEQKTFADDDLAAARKNIISKYKLPVKSVRNYENEKRVLDASSITKHNTFDKSLNEIASSHDYQNEEDIDSIVVEDEETNEDISEDEEIKEDGELELLSNGVVDVEDDEIEDNEGNKSEETGPEIVQEELRGWNVKDNKYEEIRINKESVEKYERINNTGIASVKIEELNVREFEEESNLNSKGEVTVSQDDEQLDTNQLEKEESHSMIDERSKLMTEDYLEIEEKLNEDLISDIGIPSSLHLKDNIQIHNKQSSNLSETLDPLDQIEVEQNGTNVADAIGDWMPSGAAILAREIEACGSSNEEIMSSDSETQIDVQTDDSDVDISYENRKITNAYDWRLRHELDSADIDFNANKIEGALTKYKAILRENPESIRAKYGIAKCLHTKADKMKSNDLLKDTITAYMDALDGGNITDTLFEIISANALNRTRFKGDYLTAIKIHEKIISRFPDDPKFQDDMAVTYLILNRITEAKRILQQLLQRWNNYSTAMVHYGFILKMENNLEAAVKYLSKGIDSNEPGTQESKFYFHLGDALNRLGKREQAKKVHENAVSKGMFLSKYQRSLYNVDRLLGKPWWSVEETGYEVFFKKLEDNWIMIRDEALKVDNAAFKKEGESLCETGDWRQLELYSRGVERIGCKKVPFTCKLIGEFEAAAKCKRGQVKLSLMQPYTHVWEHCGPTNTRLRAHLGLVIPPGAILRVAEETRNWQEGKVIVFDDSFEHEVWHNGTSPRLLLIVDVWHPQLTNYERHILAPI